MFNIVSVLIINNFVTKLYVKILNCSFCACLNCINADNTINHNLF